MTCVNSDQASTSATAHDAHRALEPVHIGPLTFANRAVVAPMSRVSADEAGVPTNQMVAYYAQFAAGGFGAVITEGTYTDAQFAQSYARQPGLVTEAQQHGWESVTHAVHAAGSPILAQLMHGGALSQCLPTTVAPSAIPPLGAKMPAYGGQGPFPCPAAMNQDQIQAALHGFVSAAQRAHDAGFDGVEIHAANGYLLDQFITPYTNQREDQYGSSPGNRIRLTAEVIAAIKDQLPSGFVVGVRLSQTKVNDFEHRWSGRAEAAVYFAAVADAGADYLHVASEGRNWHDTAMIEPGLSITSLARAVTGRPVIANGGMHNPDLAAQILRDGHADLLALASGALANPDWPRRIRDRLAIEQFDHHQLDESASLEHAEHLAAGTDIQSAAAR